MKQMNPMQYIAIAIANAAGYDKNTWDERLDWVKTNKNHLEDLVPESPKDKFLYIKAVKALRDAEAGKSINFIMDLDATNSGGQLMSVLGKDIKSAKATNVVNTGKREDLYGKVLNKLKSTEISRQQIKDAIIPMLYGSKAEPAKVFPNEEELNAFYYAIDRIFPILGDFLNIIPSFWNMEAKYHEWSLPDGHKVVLPSIDMNLIKLSADNVMSVPEVTPVNNPTSLLANLVHSVDAYVCREMIRMAYKQGFKLATIHDS